MGHEAREANDVAESSVVRRPRLERRALRTFTDDRADRSFGSRARIWS